MLQRNRLITPEDASRLEAWVDAVEQTSLDLLGGQPPHVVVYHYAAYVLAFGWGDNFGFFIPLMQRAVSPPGVGSALPAILRALGKLGGLARGTLPTLYEALRRRHSWNHPQFETPANLEATTAKVRAEIQQAITAIEGGEAKSDEPMEK
jgi:hypothetical protein